MGDLIENPQENRANRASSPAAQVVLCDYIPTLSNVVPLNPEDLIGDRYAYSSGAIGSVSNPSYLENVYIPIVRAVPVDNHDLYSQQSELNVENQRQYVIQPTCPETIQEEVPLSNNNKKKAVNTKKKESRSSNNTSFFTRFKKTFETKKKISSKKEGPQPGKKKNVHQNNESKKSTPSVNNYLTRTYSSDHQTEEIKKNELKLYKAIKENEIDVVKKCLENERRNVNIFKHIRGNECCLEAALSSENITIKKLLKDNFVNYYFYYYHSSTNKSEVNTIKDILKKYPDLNQYQSKNGSTLLHLACKKGNKE